MAMTLEEMELETAEFIPAREVMCGWSRHSSRESNSAYVGSSDGNTNQSGLINVSILNGNLDGNFNNVAQSA